MSTSAFPNAGRQAEDDRDFEATPSVMDGESSSWVISMMINLGVLALLAAVSIYVPHTTQTMTVQSAPEPEPMAEPQQLDLPQKFEFSDTPQTEIGANSFNGTDVALAQAPVISEYSVAPMPDIPMTDAVATDLPAQVDVAHLVATGPNFNANVSVRGSAGVGTTGASGAVDRITHEILRSLEERKTLVVWFFDKTGSMLPQREMIRDRFHRIYEELGVIEKSGNGAFKKHDKKPLLSAVVAFGDNIEFLTQKPTDDIAELQKQIAGIKDDGSGNERIFTAIAQAAERFRGYRTGAIEKRNVLFVGFTDERGSDAAQMLDPTVAACRKLQIPVYVVGVPAPFGREQVDIKYIPPKGFDQQPMRVPIDQGPESFEPEVVQLGFASATELNDAIDSGFGPYGLTRLCYETGGIYFSVHPNRNVTKRVSFQDVSELASDMSYFFDPAIMRHYRPDYVSLKEYQRLLSSNKARWSLVQASKMARVEQMARPRLDFPKADEAQFSNILSEAQKGAAVLEPKLNAIYDVLRQGEKDREKLLEPRWQAGYDLAMGRVLAVKVRTEAYNSMLARAKQGMKFKDEKSDTWELKPDDEVSVGSSLEKQAQQARTYLNRVVQEHEGTPWALMAKEELKQKLGWKWEEKYTGVNKPKEGPGGGNAPERGDDKKMMLEKKPPKAPLPKL